MQELTKVYSQRTYVQKYIYCEHTFFRYVPIHKQINDRNKINDRTKPREAISWSLYPQISRPYRLLSMSINAVPSRDSTTIQYSQWFAFITILRRERLQKGWSAVSHRGQDTRTRPSVPGVKLPRVTTKGTCSHIIMLLTKAREDPIPGSHITSSRPQELIISSCVPKHCVIFLSSSL